MNGIPTNGIRCLEDAISFRAAVADTSNTIVDLWGCIKASPKPWETPYWKSMREQVIDTKCATCGSQDGPMVLQHGWKRKKTHEARREAMDRIRNKYPYSVQVNTRSIPCCPRCGYSVAYRKTTDDWVCRRRHVSKVDDLTTKEVQDNTAAESEKRRAAHERWYCKHRDKIDRETLRILADDVVRYWSMDGCITECRRCSYLWDVRPDILIRSTLNEMRNGLVLRHIKSRGLVP